MKMLKKFILILTIIFINNNLIAGLGTTTVGPGGIKRNIEVNEIEDVKIPEKKDEINQEQEIESFELKDIDANTVGTLAEDDGGLSYKMWEGSERDLIKKYLKDLPINLESNLAIDLMKKVLLSSADIPGSDKEIDLILIRINKLLQLGDFDNAKSLIDLVSDKNNEEILIKQTEINLSLNNFDLVCSDIENKRNDFKENFFWRKVEIFCQILNNQLNKANLSLSLLKEDNNFNDNKFLKIIDSLVYKEEIDNKDLDDLNLLNLAMTRVANINLKEDYVLKNNPLLLSMIYRMPNAPIKLRIEAIERSKKLINLPIETIEEIYNSYELSKKDIKISLNEDILLGYESQAILYQMAIAEENNEKKAKILKKSLDLAIINGNFSLISNLNLKTLIEIKPSKKLSWFAAIASKSLLASNQIDEALEWFEILEKEKNEDINFFKDFVETWLIIEFFYLRNNEINYKSIPQEDILKSLDKFENKEEFANFDTLGFYILKIFGVEIHPKFWFINLKNKEFDSSILPNSSLISLLEYSSKNNKIGETILLILMSLNGKNFNEFHPFFLQTVISSLNQIGLRENTFDLAVETLIDR